MIFKKNTDEACLVNSENSIFFSKCTDQHLKIIVGVMVALYAAGVSLKLKKRHWLTPKVKYLRYTTTALNRSTTEIHKEDLKAIERLDRWTRCSSFDGIRNVSIPFVSSFLTSPT